MRERPAPPESPATRAAVLAAVRAGTATYRQIAQRHGVSYGAVSNIAVAAGIRRKARHVPRRPRGPRRRRARTGRGRRCPAPSRTRRAGGTSR